MVLIPLEEEVGEVVLLPLVEEEEEVVLTLLEKGEVVQIPLEVEVSQLHPIKVCC